MTVFPVSSARAHMPIPKHVYQAYHLIPVVILDVHPSCQLSLDHCDDFLVHVGCFPAARFVIANCFLVFESLILVLWTDIGN